MSGEIRILLVSGLPTSFFPTSAILREMNVRQQSTLHSLHLSLSLSAPEKKTQREESNIHQVTNTQKRGWAGDDLLNQESWNLCMSP